MVSVWNGHTAEALREAMRLSGSRFASLLRVSERATAQWRAQGSGIRLRWDVQRRLDGLLETATPAAQQRFTERMEHLKTPAEAMFAVVEPSVQLGLFRMEQVVGRVRCAYQEGRSRDAVADVPRVLGHPLPARLRSGVYHVASELCLQLGDTRLAGYAAQRCREEAEASGDPLVIAAGARAAAKVLWRTGKRKAAARLAVKTADDVVLDGPRGLSAHGALLLEGAVAANDLSLVDEAAIAARGVGDGRNFGWTAFGMSNVELHRAQVLTALGSPEKALRVTVDADQLPAERKAHYHHERARAWDALGDPARALTARKLAQWVAPGLLNG